jgi:hypothetical protein
MDIRLIIKEVIEGRKNLLARLAEEHYAAKLRASESR